MNIETINQSIIDADDQYIVHQLNCLTNCSAGLAKAIFDKFPYANVYAHRKYPHTPNASEQLGNIVISGNGEDQRLIIGIFGQYYPGKPKYPTSRLDGIQARKNAFESGLQRIIEIPEIHSIGFPRGIGCTLAGGDWEKYEEMIKDFAVQNPHIRVKMHLYH